MVNGDPKVMRFKVAGKVAADLAKIGRALADTGTPGAEETARAYFARDDQPYSAKSVRAMLRQRLPTRSAWSGRLLLKEQQTRM